MFKNIKILNLCDHVFVLRPTLMFPLWTMLLAGFHLGRGSVSFTFWSWLWLAVALNSMFGLVYLLNQLKDVQSDSRNGKLFLVSDGIISRRSIVIEIVVLLVLIPISMLAAGFGSFLLWVLVMFVVAGVLYNYTPIALQNHPLGGMISCLVGGWLLLEMGEQLSGNRAGLIRELPYIIAFTTAGLMTSLPDVKGDREAGKNTFAVVYGYKMSLTVASVGLLTVTSLSLVNMDMVILIPALTSTAILVIARLRNSVSLAIQGNKIAILLLSICVGYFFPAYLVVIAVYFPIAKWYHKTRFNIDYPSLAAG